MKTVKRCGVALLVLALILTMGVSVAADTPLAKPDDKANSITIHKYNLNGKVEYDNLNIGTGEKLENTDDITIDNSGKYLTDFIPIPDVPFSIQRLEKWDAAAQEWVTDTTWVGYQNINTGVVIADSSTPYIYVGKTSDPGGELPFTNLEYGRYLITELTPNGLAAKNNPFEVMVPTLLPKAPDDEWLYDIHVYPKNVDAHELVKEPVDPDPDEPADGTKMTWKFTYPIPPKVAQAEYMIITDVIKAPLVFDPDNPGLGAWTTGPDGTKAETLDIVMKGDPGEATADIVAEYDAATKTLTFTVIKANGGFGKMNDTLSASSGTETPTIHIQFDTYIDVADEDNPPEEAENDGSITYEDPDGKNDYKIEDDDKPTEDLGGIKLTKLGENTDSMAGVVFRLYGSEADALAGTAPILNVSKSDLTITPPDLVYDWTTDTNGLLNFFGLRYGTYWLVETQPPAGYNPVPAPVEVVVGTQEDGSTVKFPEKTIQNHKGFTLPPTGGRGTLFFTIAGLSLITIAGIIVIVFFRRRRNVNRTD